MTRGRTVALLLLSVRATQQVSAALRASTESVVNALDLLFNLFTVFTLSRGHEVLQEPVSQETSTHKMSGQASGSVRPERDRDREINSYIFYSYTNRADDITNRTK